MATLRNSFHQDRREKGLDVNSVPANPTLNVLPGCTSPEPKRRSKHLSVLIGKVKHPSLQTYVYLLFVFVPIGFAVRYTKQHPAIIFTINLIAILPSSSLLDYGLEQVGRRYGDLVKALLDMTFGNAVQLITSIILLHSRQVVLLQVSLIGGILSNMHLMLGLGFLAGGIRGGEQCYNSTVASTLGTLLLLAMTGLIIPTASTLLAKPVLFGILRQSRGTSVIFISMYLALLYFQLRSHQYLLDMENDEEDDPEEKAGNIWIAIAVIAVATTLIGFNTLFAADSLDGLMSTYENERSIRFKWMRLTLMCMS